MLRNYYRIINYFHTIPVGGLVAFLLPGDTRTPEKDPVET